MRGGVQRLFVGKTIETFTAQSASRKGVKRISKPATGNE